MTRSDDSRDEAFLEVLFAEERDAAEVPTPAFLAQVLRDAETVQTDFLQPAPALPPVRRGLLSQVVAAMGGWPAMAGLAAASVCGLWLGISPPEGLSDSASLYLGTSTEMFDPMSGFDFSMAEG